MQKQIQSALISVFYKDGLEPIVRKLNELNVSIYSTGGTQDFIENLGIPCISVESVTSYPSILGGRVKTLHPKVFGGILARRNREEDMQHVESYDIPLFDLVMVDLYPFEETVAQTNDEAAIIEKVDIGGVSLIRAAAKNHQDVAIIAAREQYTYLLDLLTAQQGATQLMDRKTMAIRAFEVCAHYDAAIANYFTQQLDPLYFQHSVGNKQSLRYGENPHQQAAFYGDLDALFNKLNGKETPQGSFLKYTAHEFLKKLKINGKSRMYEVNAANKKHELWQRDSLSVEIYSRDVAIQKLQYIHI